jgi:hypothetical protein
MDLSAVLCAIRIILSKAVIASAVHHKFLIAPLAIQMARLCVTHVPRVMFSTKVSAMLIHLLILRIVRLLTFKARHVVSAILDTTSIKMGCVHCVQLSLIIAVCVVIRDQAAILVFLSIIYTQMLV